MARSAGVLALALLAAGPVASCEKTEEAVAVARVRRVALVARAPIDDYQLAIYAGADAEAREARKGVLAYRVPGAEGDLRGQAAVIKEMLGAKPDALVIAPADEGALGGLDPTAFAGIPVVVIDRDIPESLGAAGAVKAVVTMDHPRAGALAAERVREVFKGGTVAMFGRGAADPNAATRESAFARELSAQPSLTLIETPGLAATTPSEARTAADALLDQHQQVGAVFCSTEIATHGMVLALRDRVRGSKVKVIGYGSGLFLAQALARGDLDALVVPDPVTVGKLGVRAALDALANKPVGARQLVGVELATRATMHDEPIKSLLMPDLLPAPAP